MSFFIGAGDEARTRYLHLGKVALYRMSYTRISNAGMIIAQIPEKSSEKSKFIKKAQPPGRAFGFLIFHLPGWSDRRRRSRL